MQFEYFTHKRGLRLVIAVILLLVGMSITLAIRSAREMKRIVSEDFNAQQLSLARHAANILEHTFVVLKRELLTLSLSPSIQYVESVSWANRMKISLSTIQDYGIFKIMLIDSEGDQSYSISYNEALFIDSANYADEDYFKWCSKPENKNRVFLSRVSKGVAENSEPSLVMKMAVPVYRVSPDQAHPVPTQGFSGVLVFSLDAPALARKFVAPIRSGKTGYGWVIDESGNFLYHVEDAFVGQNAFEARKSKDPHISFSKINLIQRARMLRGEEGTSWYVSGWHRGITGTVKKFIAFTPVRIGAANDQRIWSVAVVAPTSEVEDAVHDVYVRQITIQGVFTVAALFILVFLIANERAWLKKLEQEVQEKTKDLEDYAMRLRRSQERYRSLVESADDMIYTLDKYSQVWSMNQTWKRFTGTEPQEAIGQKISDLLEYKMPDAVLNAVDAALSSDQTISQEEEVLIGGREYWLDTKYTPLSMGADRESPSSNVLVVSRDITEHRKIESQLFHTEKLASLGSLSAGVAHEINNPLAIILGFSEMLRERFPDGSKEREILNAIERQGNTCKRIVENLLAFARIPEKAAQETSVADDLNRVINVVANTLITRKVDLKTDIDDDLPKVKGDGQQLEQVFLNIINNAVAAMEKGGILTVAAHRHKDSVSVCFTDTGHGIPREYMSKIFEPFFTTKKVGEGTGLGLSVSYAIVKRFGGEIHVASQAGGEGKESGATFTVVLPVSDSGRSHEQSALREAS